LRAVDEPGTGGPVAGRRSLRRLARLLRLEPRQRAFQVVGAHRAAVAREGLTRDLDGPLALALLPVRPGDPVPGLGELVRADVSRPLVDATPAHRDRVVRAAGGET